MVSIKNFKNLKYHTFPKKIVFPIICSKCKYGDEKIFKEEESIEKLNVFGLLKLYYYFKNMVEENISQEFMFKNYR